MLAAITMLAVGCGSLYLAYFMGKIGWTMLFEAVELLRGITRR